MQSASCTRVAAGNASYSVQAKQEEEQLKVQEEVKRRQDAIRKKEEEAAQRRYLYILAPLLSWTWPVIL